MKPQRPVDDAPGHLERDSGLRVRASRSDVAPTPGGRHETLFELRSEARNELLSTTRKETPAGVLVCGGTDRDCRVEAEHADDMDLVVAVSDDADLVSGVRAAVRFDLHDAPFLVEGVLDPIREGRWGLSLVRVFSLDRRGAARIALAPGVAQLHWSTMIDGEIVDSAAMVEDLADRGVAFRADGDTIPLARPFPAKLDIDGRQIPCLAEARHAQRDASQTRYGVSLQTQLHGGALTDVYLRRRFPQLVPRRELDPGLVVGLLRESGYLALRDDMTPARDWLNRDDDQNVSRDVCYRALDGALVGHVSFTRAYPRAWLGHQLATVRSHPEATRCRKTIYQHIANYPGLEGENAMMVGYFNRERPWHRRFFSGFAEWLGVPELATTFALDRFERRPGTPLRANSRVDVEVSPPRADELVAVAMVIRAHLPPLIAEVLDVHPERLSSAALHDAYRGTRYHRGRQALVLRVGGRVAGVALCETGSRELSIFNLFNMAQVFMLTGRHAPDADAQLSLLYAVREFYAQRGEEHPMVVAPPDTFAAAEAPDTFCAETMGMIAWSGRALQQYENFINYEFGKDS